MQPVLTEVADVSQKLLRALKRALTITTPSSASAGESAGPGDYPLIVGFAPAAQAAILVSLKSLAAIPPATVFCFAMTLSSLSLWRHSQKPAPKRRAARFCGALVALAGLLTLSQYFGAWDIPVPLWLFHDEAGSPLYLTLMSFNNALCFTFTGLALTRLRSETERGNRIAQLLFLASGFSAITTIVGFLYSAPDSRFFSFTSATMFSALAILTLNVVAMAMQEGGGMIAGFVSRRPEGILARRLAIGGGVTVIVVSFLTEWGEQASLLQPQAQKAMLVVMGIAIMAALVWHAMRDIAQLEARLLKAEALEVRRLQAEASAMFNPAECLNFRYEYDVMPEGLLPRFIVCAQGLTEDIFRTHTCVILRFEDGRALVKADVENKKVFIHVTGKADARRRLLAVIRSDFERIHADLKFKPAELVPLIGHPDEAVTYKELVVYEQNGITEFTKVVGSNIVKVDVQQHLNGVDLAGTRRRESRREELEELREDPARVFISYSHKDERFRLALEPHLKLLQRQRLIADWHDRLIEPGAEWASVIDANLEDAKIILLLVSADFIASDYCWEIEMKRALERHEKGEACVLPIIIRESKWDTAPFAKLQVLPENGKAVDLWKRKDQAWRSITEVIEKIAKEL